MNFKHSLVFFSAGIILILFLFLMGAVPMGIIPLESSQQQQQQEKQEKQNDESVHDTPLLKEEFVGDGNNDKAQQITIVTTTEEKGEDFIDNTQTYKSKPIEEMDCIELKEFAMSFEQGWGSAVALHDKRCS